MKKQITYKGIEFDIEFSYTPGEQADPYNEDGSGYPGAAPEINIYSISHKKTDFVSFLDEAFVDWEEDVKEILLKTIW